MVKFIHTSDIHLGFAQYGLEERFKDYARTFNEVASHTIDAKADFLLIAGDLFDKRNINAATYLQAYKILSRLKDAGVPVFAIEGNHDQAYYRDKHSWLQTLDKQGLLNLLKVKKGEYDLNYLGDYRECAGARIFGVKYIGAATKGVMEDLARDIKAVEERDGKPEITILMMHFGMEGQLKRDIGGEIPLSALAALKNHVDYLALGHYHMQYELDGWIFNGGSPDLVSMEEHDYPKGFYLHDNGTTTFIDSRSELGIRETRRLRLKVDGMDSPADLYDAVQKLTRASSENFRNPPLVDLLLNGELRFQKADIDKDRLVELVQASMKSLHVNLKLQASGVEYSVDSHDHVHSSRAEIEKKVFMDQIRLDTRYQPHSQMVLAALMEVKEKALGKADGEELMDVMRKAFTRLGQEPEESPKFDEMEKRDFNVDEEDNPVDGFKENDDASYKDDVKESDDASEDGVEENDDDDVEENTEEKPRKRGAKPWRITDY